MTAYTCQPGDQTRGTVGFEVPANASGLRFYFDNSFDDEHAAWRLSGP